jgi:hypothetical protein
MKFFSFSPKVGKVRKARKMIFWWGNVAFQAKKTFFSKKKSGGN